jgi:hypothetical protein
MNQYPPNQQWPEKGTKLKAKDVLPELVYPMFTNIVEDAHNNIEPGKEYTVSKCNVYSSWCAVWLEEFPDNDRHFHLSFFKWNSQRDCTAKEMNDYIMNNRYEK